MLMWGQIPVPWTVSWTGEERQFVAIDPHVRRRALMMDVAPGIGKPQFGKPHSQRQRQCIAECRCDTCGRPIQSTELKISLSHARFRDNAAVTANGTGILQVEPLLDRACARDAIRWCPSLKKDIAVGTLSVLQVMSHRVQFAIMGVQFIQHYVPDFVPTPADAKGIVGHAKVELLRWKNRDQQWLEAA